MQRRAHWIWRERGAAFAGVNPLAGVDPNIDANLYVHFRRAFRLDAVPATAPVRISADGRYRLWVNGAYIGRGPARCEPLFQYYDVHDVTGHLRAGENVIAVLVHTYGRDMSWYELPRAHWARTFGCGGFFAECDAVPEIDSGAAWRYQLAGAWERDTPAGSVGFAEVYDARTAIDGWTAGAFDDSAWPAAVALTAPGIGLAPPVVPFPHMVARDIPHLLEEARDAVRIATIAEVPVADAADLIAIAEERAQPLASCTVAGPGAMIAGGAAASELRLVPGRAVTLVIDFGRDVTGYPRIEVEGPAGAMIDVSYSERLRGDGRVTVQRPNPITSQNVHRYVLRDGAQSWEKFDRAGFRYLQFTAIAAPEQPDAPLRIRHANVNFTSYPAGDRGSFACSDDTLTRIWRAGAYTLRLCMQDGFEDCPSREQRQWIGDAQVEALINYACFGDTRLTAKLIRQVAQSQRRDGMTQMATPSDMSARWPLYIVDYCLAWITTIGEYVLHTGDDAIVADVFPSVERSVAWFERHIGADDLLVDPPGWIFIDWAEVDRRGACTVLNALLARALGHAAVLADHEGAVAAAARWRDLAKRIGDALNRLLWDDARGVYVDALLPGGACRRVSQHANAAMIAAGVAPRERWTRMLDYVMDPARLAVTSTAFGATPDTPIDEERQVVLAQPFFMHVVHRALAAAGRGAQLADNIRTHWSPMLADDGVDTMWEHWHGEDSRCHAWSATPTYDLSTEVLGVRPLAPGFARFRVAPHIEGLDWAEGVYPSVRGDIAIAWQRSAAALTLEIDVPPGTEAEVVLPSGTTATHVDGAPVAPASVIEGLGPGKHAVQAALSGA
jgi:hypothetical protein